MTGIKVLPCAGEVAKLSSYVVSKHSKQKDANKLHRELKHPGEDVTKPMGKHMGFKIT